MSNRKETKFLATEGSGEVSAIIDFDHHEFLFNFNRDENIVVVYFKKIKQNTCSNHD